MLGPIITWAAIFAATAMVGLVLTLCRAAKLGDRQLVHAAEDRRRRQARIVNDEVDAAARASVREFSNPARFDQDHEARS